MKSVTDDGGFYALQRGQRHLATAEFAVDLDLAVELGLTLQLRFRLLALAALAPDAIASIHGLLQGFSFSGPKGTHIKAGA